jgi:hypothetical protein
MIKVGDFRMIIDIAPRFLQTHLAVTPLRFACSTRPAHTEDFHLLVTGHAGRTKGQLRLLFWRLSRATATSQCEFQ